MSPAKWSSCPYLFIRGYPIHGCDYFADDTLETAALKRWGNGDPSGFLEISAPAVTYFDPFLSARLDGLPALSAYYETLRGKVHIDRFELLAPRVEASHGLAVLSFNFFSYSGAATQRWHCTEVYRHTEVGWRILQTHWSISQPLAPTPNTESAA